MIFLFPPTVITSIVYPNQDTSHKEQDTHKGDGKTKENPAFAKRRGMKVSSFTWPYPLGKEHVLQPNYNKEPRRKQRGINPINPIRFVLHKSFHTYPGCLGSEYTS